MAVEPTRKFTESQDTLITVLNDHRRPGSDLARKNPASDLRDVSSSSSCMFEDVASSRYSADRLEAHDRVWSTRSTKFEDAMSPTSLHRAITRNRSEEEACFVDAHCIKHCHSAQSCPSQSSTCEEETASTRRSQSASEWSDASSPTSKSSGTSESAMSDFFEVDKSVSKVRISRIATLAKLPHDWAARNARKSHEKNLQERKEIRKHHQKSDDVRRTLHEIGGSVKSGYGVDLFKVEPGTTMSKKKKFIKGKAARRLLKKGQKHRYRNSTRHPLNFVEIPTETSTSSPDCQQNAETENSTKSEEAQEETESSTTSTKLEDVPRAREKVGTQEETKLCHCFSSIPASSVATDSTTHSSEGEETASSTSASQSASDSK